MIAHNIAEVIGGLERRKIALERGLLDGGKVWAAKAEGYAKERARYDSGNMRSGTHGTARIIRPFVLEVKVSNRVPYAAAHEFGTAKISPQAFIRPGLHQAMPEGMEAIRKSIQGSELTSSFISDMAGAVGA